MIQPNISNSVEHAPDTSNGKRHLSLARSAATHGRPSHVLIVSDDPSQLEPAIDFLQGQLFRVSSAKGWKGYYHAQAWRPEIILIDGVMQDMDPFMMGRLLMQTPDTQSIPIIFLLDRGSEASSREAFALGAVDCLTKPVYPEELLARISVHLRRGSHAPDPEATHRSWTPASEDLLVRNALSAIESDVGSIHTVRHLARRIGTNERKLSTLFKVRMGKSAHKVIFAQKMETARRLLANTGMPVREVANHVGFRSVCNFSVAFHRDQGITPSAFRRQARSCNTDLPEHLASDDMHQHQQAGTSHHVNAAPH